MPRLDLRVTVENTLSYESQLVLAVVIEALNSLREPLGLGPLTPQDLHEAARDYVRAHPPVGRV